VPLWRLHPPRFLLWQQKSVCLHDFQARALGSKETIVTVHWVSQSEARKNGLLRPTNQPTDQDTKSQRSNSTLTRVSHLGKKEIRSDGGTEMAEALKINKTLGPRLSTDTCVNRQWRIVDGANCQVLRLCASYQLLTRLQNSLWVIELSVHTHTRDRLAFTECVGSIMREFIVYVLTQPLDCLHISCWPISANEDRPVH
jgi:hypothetical protein